MAAAWEQVNATAAAPPPDGTTTNGLTKSSVDIALIDAVHRARWQADPAKVHLTFENRAMRAVE